MEIQVQVQEAWRVRVDDRVYEADLTELIEWVKEGAVAPDDLVQKGTLRWLSAARVPELSVHYYKPSIPVVDDALAQLERNGHLAFEPTIESDEPTSSDGETSNDAEQATKQHCSKHPDEATAVVCEICHTSFCSRCPHRFGNVRLCPLCGGICANYEDVLNGAPARGALNKPYARKVIDTADTSIDSGKRLGVRDLLRGLAYTFSNPIDLLISSLLLSGCIVGLTLFLDGSAFKSLVTLACTLLLVIFSYDRLSLIYWNIKAGTRSNGSWSRRRAGFEGAFFRRSGRAIAVFASSFGLFIALLSVAGIFAWSRFASDAELTESAIQKARHTVAQELQGPLADINTVKIASTVNESRSGALSFRSERSYQASDFPVERILMSFMRLSVYYLAPIFILLIAGLVHLPSAYSTALATGSVRKILNPLNPLRYLRLLGFDYILIVFALLSLVVAFSLVSWAAYVFLPLLLAPSLAVTSAFLILGIFLAIGWSMFSYLLAMSVHRRIDDPAEAAN